MSEIIWKEIMTFLSRGIMVELSTRNEPGFGFYYKISLREFSPRDGKCYQVSALSEEFEGAWESVKAILCREVVAGRWGPVANG